MSKEFKSSIFFYQDTLILPKNNPDTSLQLNTTNYVIIRKTSYNEFKPIIKENVKTTQIFDPINNRPEFIMIKSIDKSLIKNYIDYTVFILSKDSNCYIVNKQNTNTISSRLLIETNKNIKHIGSDYIIKEKQAINSDWTIIPIVLGLFLLASIVVRYSKYLGLLFESVVYRYSTNKILNEKNSQFKRLTILLDTLFVITFALAVDQIVKGLGIYTPPEKFQFIVFTAIGFLVIVLWLFRLIVFKLSALFSNHKIFFNDLFISASLYSRTLGVFLLPLVFLITYSTGLLNTIIIYLSIFIILIMLILRMVSIFRAFIVKGFSIFYFILYLCALEIVPLLVIWKEVKSR